MFEQIINREGNRFYRLNEDAVVKAQESSGIVFPEALAEFYSQVGYGFLKSEKYNFNRIMDPGSVCDFRLRQGQFADNDELEIYSSAEENELFFFEVCESLFISIGITQTNSGKIYFNEKEIADTLEEFLAKYQENENYFMPAE